MRRAGEARCAAPKRTAQPVARRPEQSEGHAQKITRDLYDYCIDIQYFIQEKSK